MAKWIILLTCALSISACTTDPTYGGAGSSGMGSSGMGSSGMGSSGMGSSGTGASGMGDSAHPKDSTTPAPATGTPYGTPPESSGSPGSSGSSGSSGKPEPMPSGSGAGGIYDGGSSNNAKQR